VLWARHAATQAEVRRRTIDPIPVWGQPERPQPEPLSTREKDALFDREIRSKNEQLSSAYARLKLAMDYWCALWFWPIDQAHLFPSRDEYLMEVSYILKGEQYVSVPADVVQLKLLGGDQMALKEAEDNVGAVNIAEMCHRLPRLQLVQELASLHQFLHWELEFADQFANNGGFDLVVGNPPWIKVEWEEGGVLGDTEPLFVFRDFSAANLSAVRNAAIERNHGLRPHYLEEYRNACSTQAFLTGQHNYPNLTGTKANLYKCFILKAWVINNCEGVAAFIHPEGVYDDPNGGPLRAELFDRIRYHFQFQNELPLFPEIGNRIRFSINVYGPRQGAEFLSISNLFSPTTADDSLDSYCCGPVGGIKTEDGKNWNLKGHPFRVIEIGTDELRLFASMYGNSAAPEKGAALPVLHSRQLLDVLRKISSAQLRLGTTTERHLLTQLWNETIAQHNGTIQRQTQFPSEIGNSVISGPHFYVCNPLYKTPRRVCNTHRAYDNVDLCHIPSDWIPRSNYIPLGDRVEYLHRSPSVNWGDQDSVINYYRLCCRRQLGLDGERTLIPALIPAHAAHIDSVLGLCTDNPGFLAGVLGMWSSVPLDFFVKISGRSDIRTDLASKLPIPSQGSPWFFELIARTLALNCVSAHYSAFWDTVWDSRIATARWTRPDKRLDQDFFAMLTKNWAPSLSIRADYARRQALVEIDVLVSLELGLTLDELQTIYRIQFPVLQQNEKDTWYDRNGRIVFTCSKGLPGVGFSRAEWNKIKDMMSGQVHRTILDDTLPGGPRERTITYEAPFDRCDRELDYAIAWAAFESRFAADRIGVGGRPC